MARKEAVPPRELGICYRLGEFRRSTKIPRTTFALTVGISGERLASYEMGRVPLRYGMFKAINQHFHVRLDWLVNDRGPVTSHKPFDDSRFSDQIDDRELLSVIYDTVLSKHGDPDKEDVDTFFFGPDGLDAKLREVERIVTNPKECKKLPKDFFPVVLSLLERVLDLTKKAAERNLAVEEKYRRAMQRTDKEKQ